MTFLNPAMLFGLLAASIPVLIHLLNLRKLKKVEFSTLAFLKEIQKTKIRRLKLKQWILLALRVLIILLLVSAFARPTVDAVSIGGLSSSAKSTAVFVIDNSYSMSYVGEEGSFFNQAKSIVSSVVNDMKEGDDATMILTAGKSADAARIKNPDRFVKILNDSHISYAKGNLSDALTEAGKILSSSNNFNKQIFLLSDLQKSNWSSDSISTINDLDHFPENAQLYVIPFSPRTITNAAITKFHPDNQIFELGRKVSFTGEIANTGTNDIKGLIVSLFINGKRTAQKNIDVLKGKTVKIDLETDLNETGLLNVVLAIADDDIQFDNKRFAGIYAPEKISVLLLTEKPEDAVYVRTALLSAERKNFSLTEKQINEIYSTDLKSFDVIFLIGAGMTSGYSPVTDFIEAGGSVALFPSSGQEIAPFYQLCSALGMPKPVELETLELKPIEINYFDLNSLLFNNIFSDKKNVSLESPKIFKFIKNIPTGYSRAVMKLPDNSAFMSVKENGKGKAIAFYSAPVLEWSDFPLKNLFSPLIVRSVNYLVSSSRANSSYTPGSPVTLNLSSVQSSPIEIESSFGLKILIPADKLAGKRKYKFEETFVPGNYKVLTGGKISDYFSVNPDARESIYDYFTPEKFREKLKAANVKSKIIVAQPDEDIRKIIKETRYGSELWRLFLVLALIAAVAEMLLSKNSKKEMREFGNDS